MKTLNSKSTDRWSPIRRGITYCSPGCGGGCTHAAFVQATADAEALAKRLGPSWVPHVWENLGWHYEAKLEVAKDFTLRIMRSRNDSEYHALLGDSGGEMHWTENFYHADPVKVANRQLELAERYVLAKAARLIALRKAMQKGPSRLESAKRLLATT